MQEGKERFFGKNKLGGTETAGGYRMAVLKVAYCGQFPCRAEPLLLRATAFLSARKRQLTYSFYMLFFLFCLSML
jgi:hypothetical protein